MLTQGDIYEGQSYSNGGPRPYVQEQSFVNMNRKREERKELENVEPLEHWYEFIK